MTSQLGDQAIVGRLLADNIGLPAKHVNTIYVDNIIPAPVSAPETLQATMTAGNETTLSLKIASTVDMYNIADTAFATNIVKLSTDPVLSNGGSLVISTKASDPAVLEEHTVFRAADKAIEMKGNIIIDAVGDEIQIGKNTDNQPLGSESVAIGENAGTNGTTGTRAVNIGFAAGRNNCGSRSVAIGDEAGEFNTDFAAVSIGLGAGENGTGAGAVCIGRDTGTDSAGSSNIFLGNAAGSQQTGSNKLIIGSGAQATEAAEEENNIIWGEMSTLAATQTLKLNAETIVNGDLNVLGNANIDGNTFSQTILGTAWYNNLGGMAIDFATANTWYKFDMATNNRLNGVHLVDGNFQMEVDGLYRVDYKAEGEGSNNHDYITTILVNDVNQDNCNSRETLPAVNDVRPMGKFCYLDLLKDDYVTLAVMDWTGTSTGKVYNYNVAIERHGKYGLGN